MTNRIKTCFVCNCDVKGKNTRINKMVRMPVCVNCADTKEEKNKEQELLDSLADGLVCGCI